jgi:hypothetical protein
MGNLGLGVCFRCARDELLADPAIYGKGIGTCGGT